MRTLGDSAHAVHTLNSSCMARLRIVYRERERRKREKERERERERKREREII